MQLGCWDLEKNRALGKLRGDATRAGPRAAAEPTSRESRGLYKTAGVPPTYIIRWLAAVHCSRSYARYPRSDCFLAHSCSRLLRIYSYAMTVSSKMNSVSRQSVLSRLGPGGLLYAANKILAVRHRNVLVFENPCESEYFQVFHGV